MTTIRAVFAATWGPLVRRALLESVLAIAAAVVAQIGSSLAGANLDPVTAYLAARAITFAERVFFQARRTLAG